MCQTFGEKWIESPEIVVDHILISELCDKLLELLAEWLVELSEDKLDEIENSLCFCCALALRTLWPHLEVDGFGRVNVKKRAKICQHLTKILCVHWESNIRCAQTIRHFSFHTPRFPVADIVGDAGSVKCVRPTSTQRLRFRIQIS